MSPRFIITFASFVAICRVPVRIQYHIGCIQRRWVRESGKPATMQKTFTGTWMPAWVPENSVILGILLILCSIVQSTVRRIAAILITPQS